jgi:glycosyltransferase involved in cell wall biosynthesis
LQKVPHCNVVQAISGYGTELFVRADEIGALKVIDCPNSHPATFHEIWQRECDLWCPGEKVPIPQWMFVRMNRELERADLILCPSLFVRDTMFQNGIPEQKCFVNPFGVDLSIFKPRPAVPDKIRFVCVGTICLRKGHQYLFRAWQIVRCELPDAELICVGEYKTDFRLERPKWERSFTHIPRLAQAGLGTLLTTCTAFVFPSQEEGFARVQIEAMACALPIIGTHEAGTTTVVQDGVEGLIVQGRDPEQIAAAMIRLGRDRDLNQRLGDAAYKKVAANNSWQDYGDRLLSEYNDRLGAARGKTIEALDSSHA